MQTKTIKRNVYVFVAWRTSVEKKVYNKIVSGLRLGLGGWTSALATPIESDTNFGHLLIPLALDSQFRFVSPTPFNLKLRHTTTNAIRPQNKKRITLFICNLIIVQYLILYSTVHRHHFSIPPHAWTAEEHKHIANGVLVNGNSNLRPRTGRWQGEECVRLRLVDEYE